MSSHKLVIKDAAWQLFGRVISALFGFVITKIIASYLGPLRYGDYGTIFRYFARWTALVDFGIYVIAVRTLGKIKEENPDDNTELQSTYGKFVGTRTTMIVVVYTLAIVIAYLIPAYTNNPYIIWGLPLAMLYSASNMFAGIQQLPLQIFWKMKRLSWSLIIARFSQLAVLLPAVFLLFKNVNFDSPTDSTIAIVAFCLVVFSVVASSIGQNVEMHFKTKDLLPLKIKFDKKFTSDILKSNRKYGFSYFFSSFHTLIVLMFLGWFFPTASGFKYVGLWSLSLSLIEILLIIPSSLGNSLLHKITSYTKKAKQQSMGNLLSFVFRIGGIVAINFCIFSEQIIRFVSSNEFLGSRGDISLRGSNQILPFLGIVLLLSFIKQIYNYLFVSLDRQNVLFWINLIGVAIGIGVGLIILPKYSLFGGVITQMLIEILFVIGAIFCAKKEKMMPILQRKPTLILTGILIVFSLLGRGINELMNLEHIGTIGFLVIALIFNGILVLCSFKPVKQVARGLTSD